MTTHQITLVQQSFELLKPVALQAGELFYQKLFAAAPQVKPMFKAPIAEQAGKLMYTLAFVVSHLQSPETLLAEVARLGKRHQQYGAEPAHYDLVGTVLLDTLAAGLGNHWNDELAQAWASAYTLVANAMIEAQQKIAA